MKRTVFDPRYPNNLSMTNAPTLAKRRSYLNRRQHRAPWNTNMMFSKEQTKELDFMMERTRAHSFHELLIRLLVSMDIEIRMVFAEENWLAFWEAIEG